MTIQEAFNIIEMKNNNIIYKLQQAYNYEEACSVVNELHKLVNKQRKLLAKKYHPDKGGDEEKFKIINDVCDQLLNVKVEPVPVYSQTIIIRSDYGTTGGTTTSSWWT